MKAEPKERTPAVPAIDDPETMATTCRLEALADAGLAAGYDGDELPDGIVCAIVAVGNGEGLAGESAEQVAVLLNAGKHPDGTVRGSLSAGQETLVRAALGKVLAGEYCSPEGLGDAGMGVEKALRAICDDGAVRSGDAAFAVAVARNGEYESARQVGLKLIYTGDSAQVQSLIAAALCETFGDGGWVWTRDLMHEHDARYGPNGNAGHLARHFARMRRLRAARRAKAAAQEKALRYMEKTTGISRSGERTLAAQGLAEVRAAARGYVAENALATGVDPDIVAAVVAEREQAEREG